MKNQQTLSASNENYIKAIFHIVEEKQAARVKDISKYLNIGPSSVSEALKILAEKQLVNYEPYGIITLSERGQKLAQNIISRHNIIRNFFENVLSVSSEDSEKSTNKVEYSVSEDVLNKFVMFLEFMQTCSCKEPKWMKSFKHYSQNSELSDKCLKCIELKNKNPDKIDNSHCCGMVN